MKTIKKTSVLAFLIFINFVYSQKTWLPVTTSFEPDEKTFMALNTNNTIWIKKVSKNIEFHTQQGKKNIDGYELMLFKVDCDNRKLGLIQIVVYDKKGKTVNSTKLKDYEVDMDYVIPDSVGETYLDTYCNLPLIE